MAIERMGFATLLLVGVASLGLGRFADLPASKLDEAWSNLMSSDDSRLTKAILTLAKNPAESVPFLKTKLRPVQIDQTTVRQWIADFVGGQAERQAAAALELDYVLPLVLTELDSAVRAKSDAKLNEQYQRLLQGRTGLGSTRGQNGSVELEVQTLEPANWFVDYRKRQSWSRAVRATAILEQIGNPDAIAMLRTIADGEVESLPTVAAQDALIRLGQLKPSPQVPAIQSVFESYRNAKNANDLHTQLKYYSPSLLDETVYQTYMTCTAVNSPSVVALYIKFGIDSSKVTEAYRKEYKVKYGVDLEKLQAEHQAKLAKALIDQSRQPETNVVPPPPALGQPSIEARDLNDTEIYRQVLSRLVQDKIGFIVAASNAVEHCVAGRTTIGEMQDVYVQGDKAIGQYKARDCFAYGAHGQNPHVTCQSRTDQMIFRNSKSGWLIERLRSPLESYGAIPPTVTTPPPPLIGTPPVAPY